IGLIGYAEYQLIPVDVISCRDETVYHTLVHGGGRCTTDRRCIVHVQHFQVEGKEACAQLAVAHRDHDTRGHTYITVARCTRKLTRCGIEVRPIGFVCYTEYQIIPVDVFRRRDEIVGFVLVHAHRRCPTYRRRIVHVHHLQVEGSKIRRLHAVVHRNHDTRGHTHVTITRCTRKLSSARIATCPVRLVHDCEGM